MATLPGRKPVPLILCRWGWMYAGLIVLGLALAGLTLFQTVRELRLSWFGIAAMGIVTGLQQETRSCDMPRSGLAAGEGCTRYAVAFRFEAAGRTQVARSFVNLYV